MNMWSLFSKQTIVESNILNGMTDYHSHVLPGVDDGVSTSEKAFELLAFYEELGIRHVWLTPHIMEDYPNKTDILRQQFEKFFTEYVRYSKNPVTLSLASENMLDSLFMQRLSGNDLLPIIDSSHLLVETSYYIPPFHFKELLEQIMNKGYTLILAHPERYHYLSTMQEYEELYHRGIQLQLDIASIVGAYGEEARSKALALLQKGYYSLIGTDVHHKETFVKWINIPIQKTVLKKMKYLIDK